MTNATANPTATTVSGQEVYATMLSSLCVFFNSFVAWVLWKVDVLHLILIEMICLNIGTLVGVVTLELMPEVYKLVNSGTLDFINVSIVLTIGWTLPLTIEKLIKRGKGNKYRRLMQNTGLDGQQGGGIPKSLRTVVKERIAEKNAKSAEQAKRMSTQVAKKQQRDEENSRSDVHRGQTENKEGTPEPVKTETGDVELAARGRGQSEAAASFNIHIHDDEGDTLISGKADETVVAEKPKPKVAIQASSSTSNFADDGAKTPTSTGSDSMGSQVSSNVVANFDADAVPLSPHGKEMEKALEGDEDEAEELARKVASGEDVPLIIIMLMGDIIHNFVDGGVLAAAYHVNNSVGVATFIGIFLEEIPHLTSTFAVFVQAGAPVWKALVLNAIGAVPFIVGAGIILGVLSNPNARKEDVNYLLPFACGSFLYVALTDLVPIISMYWHGWIRALSHLMSVGLGILIQSAIRVYGASEGSYS